MYDRVIDRAVAMASWRQADLSAATNPVREEVSELVTLNNALVCLPIGVATLR